MTCVRSLLHRRSIITSPYLPVYGMHPSSRPSASFNMQLKFRPPTDLLNPSACSPLSSCMVSPSLESVSEDNDDRSDMGYFRRELVDSPVPQSPSDADSEGAESDDTLEDTEMFTKLGYPLERIPRNRGYDVAVASDSEQEFGHAVIYHSGTSCSSCSSLYSPSPVTSLFTYVTFYPVLPPKLTLRGIS